MHSPSVVQQIEDCIHRDPAGRGLIASEPQFGRLCAEQLADAAENLVRSGSSALIVTGFFIPLATIAAGETDGPPGAVLLAAALQEVGISSRIITDTNCRPSVAAAAEFIGLRDEQVIAIEESDPADWLCKDLAANPSLRPTHLIAVERVGPSHTIESIAMQYPDDPARRQEFAEAVPAEHRDRCHNMRGRIIDEYSAPLHRLFEDFSEHCPGGRTIGIGDGGNEIGMGSLPWHEIRRRISGEQASRLPCRIATDFTILAGVSNWGALALAAVVLKLKGRLDVLAPWTADFHERMLEHLVEHGPAVDGVSGKAEPTVDGLPFITYIQPWEGIRRLLGL